jgi:hypothetical protein
MEPTTIIFEKNSLQSPVRLGGLRTAYDALVDHLIAAHSNSSSATADFTSLYESLLLTCRLLLAIHWHDCSLQVLTLQQQDTVEQSAANCKLVLQHLQQTDKEQDITDQKYTVLVRSRQMIEGEQVPGWAYQVSSPNEDDEEDDSDGGNMLPTRAELAAEEEMLWRMAETPIP